MKIGFFVLFVVGIQLAFSQKDVHDLVKAINESKDPKTKIDALNTLASIKRVSNPDTTILLTRQSEKLAVANHYGEEAADAIMTRAIAHSIKGEYYLALQVYMEAKTAYEKLDLQNALAMCLSNIGTLYDMMQDDKKALQYYEASAAACVRLGDIGMEGVTLNNIGYILKQNGEYEASLKKLRRSLFIANESGNTQKIAYPTYNIGSVYTKLNQVDSASYYLKNAILLAEKVNDKFILCLAKMDLGLMNMQMGRLGMAEELLLESHALSVIAGISAEKGNSAGHLASIYEKLAQPQKALHYFKLHKSVEDSLFNRDLTRKTAFAEAEYSYNQQKIIDLAAQDQALTRASWTKNTLIVSLIVMILVVLWLFNSAIKRKRSNIELKNLNLQIEEQAKLLKIANEEVTIMNSNLESVIEKRTKELKAKNQKLRDYLSSHSHVVRAPLARIIGLVQVYDPTDNKTIDLIKDNLEESAVELDEALKEINRKIADDDTTSISN